MSNIDIKLMLIDLSENRLAGINRNVNPLSIIIEEQLSGLETVVLRIGQEVYNKQTAIIEIPRVIKGPVLRGDLLPIFCQSPYLLARVLATGLVKGINAAIIVNSSERQKNVDLIMPYISYNWEKWRIEKELLDRIYNVTVESGTYDLFKDCDKAKAIQLPSNEESINKLCADLKQVFQ